MRRLLFVLVAVCTFVLPLFANNYTIRLATTMAMYCVLALSWNFIGGFTGYPSFATAAFFGLGAYSGAISQVQGIPMYIAWTFGSFIAAVFAALIGPAILHLKGHYFAIASLVAVEVLREVANTSTKITGGGMGLTLPILRLDPGALAKFFYYPMLILAMLSVTATYYVSRSSLGFGLRCIKQNEDAANMVGINTTMFKTTAFVLSSIFAGYAGAIYASWVNYIEPGDVFDILLSLKPIVMVMLGSAGTVVGPVVGSFVLLIIEEVVWRNFLTFHAGALGILVIILTLYLPEGLLSFSLRRFWKGRR